MGYGVDSSLASVGSIESWQVEGQLAFATMRQKFNNEKEGIIDALSHAIVGQLQEGLRQSLTDPKLLKVGNNNFSSIECYLDARPKAKRPFSQLLKDVVEDKFKDSVIYSWMRPVEDSSRLIEYNYELINEMIEEIALATLEKLGPLLLAYKYSPGNNRLVYECKWEKENHLLRVDFTLEERPQVSRQNRDCAVCAIL